MSLPPAASTDSSDTDRPVTMGNSAADRDNIADQSQVGTENSLSTAAVASVGSDAVLSVAADTSASAGIELSSGDKTASSADSKNIELHEEGAETPSAENIDSHDEGVEKVSVAENSEVGESAKNIELHEENVEMVSASSAAETSKSTEKSFESANDVSGVGVNYEQKITNKSTANDVTGHDHVDQTAETTNKTPTAQENNIDDANVADFLALSYLVHPPDGSTFDQPYVDNFWQCRWKRMEPEIRRVLRKSSRLASDVITLDSSSSECDSSDGEYSGEYEDSMASNSPIFVQEKKKTTPEDDDDDDGGDNDDDDACDEIVLDENSSNAIVVGDDDDDDDDVDEIICDDEKNGDASIVLCDGENSSPRRSSAEPSVSRPQDVESSTHSSSVVGVDSAADVDMSDKCGESGKVANGSADVEAAVVKTDKPGCETEAGKDADADAVSNGACHVDGAGDS